MTHASAALERNIRIAVENKNRKINRNVDFFSVYFISKSFIVWFTKENKQVSKFFAEFTGTITLIINPPFYKLFNSLNLNIIFY